MTDSGKNSFYRPSDFNALMRDKSFNPHPTVYAPDSEAVAKMEELEEKIVALQGDPPTREEQIAAARADLMSKLNNSDSVSKPTELSDEQRCTCGHYMDEHCLKTNWCANINDTPGQQKYCHCSQYQEAKLPQPVQPAPSEFKTKFESLCIHCGRPIACRVIPGEWWHVDTSNPFCIGGIHGVLAAPITAAEEVTLPALDVTEEEVCVAEDQAEDEPTRADMIDVLSDLLCRERQLLAALTEIAALKKGTHG